MWPTMPYADTSPILNLDLSSEEFYGLLEDTLVPEISRAGGFTPVVGGMP